MNTTDFAVTLSVTLPVIPKVADHSLNNAVGNDEIDLHRAGLNGETAAELINFSASGLKQGAQDLSNFERRIKSFARLFVQACRP